MSIRFYAVIAAILSFAGIVPKAHAGQKYQEFPIAVGQDSTFAFDAAYSGTNTLVGIMGDTTSRFSITAQLVKPPDSLIGNRISVGRTGASFGPRVEFDGTNYLLVWEESNGDINGQFVSPSGYLVGNYFNIGTNASVVDPGLYNVCFGDTAYLVIFVKTDANLYGQLVGKSGNLIGSQIQINNLTSPREVSVAFDGTNYLVVWVDDVNDKNIYGQFISKTGSLVGSNFLIDGGPNYSDDPTYLAFDGSRYLLAFHEAPDTNSPWTLYGFFITTAGMVQDTIIICDSTKHPVFPCVAFDGNNYFITWTQFSDLSLMGQVWTPQGVPIDTPILISQTTGGKFPAGGCGYGGNLYFIVWTELDTNFTDGDVYGRFIQKTGIEEKSGSSASAPNILLQNTPNLFKSTTTIKYIIPGDAFVNLSIYNVYGQLVYTLVKERKYAGTYTAIWNGRDERGNKVRSGIYFYRLDVGNLRSTRKMLLVK